MNQHIDSKAQYENTVIRHETTIHNEKHKQHQSKRVEGETSGVAMPLKVVHDGCYLMRWLRRSSLMVIAAAMPTFRLSLLAPLRGMAGM